MRNGSICLALDLSTRNENWKVSWDWYFHIIIRNIILEESKILFITENENWKKFLAIGTPIATSSL